MMGRASFELELGASGQSTDFKEGNKTMEWTLRKVGVFGIYDDCVRYHSLSIWKSLAHLLFMLQIAGGSEHVLRVKLTLSQERNGNGLEFLQCDKAFVTRML